MKPLIIQGVQETIDGVRQKQEEYKKALSTAMRVEGFRMKNLLQSQIKSGAVAGRTFAPLTEVRKRYLNVFGKRRGKTPLFTLSKAIRYNVPTQDPFSVEIGFVDWKTGTLSKSWKNIAEKLQEGMTTSVNDHLRRFFGFWGAAATGVKGRKKRMQGPERSYALKKTTTSLKTPARQIIDPFWASQKGLALSNIERDFYRKIKGERI